MSDYKTAWKRQASKYWFKTPWLKLREDRVALPNGVELEQFHVMEYPDWALSICQRADKKLVMVEQYRYASESLSLEFPAGMIEKEEPPLDGAKREMVEETGYVSEEWHFLGKCRPEPARHTNEAHLYLATDAKKITEPDPDAAEMHRVLTMTVDEIFQSAEEGRLVHGIHLAALYRARYLRLI